jgi:hypothetical protein
LGKKRILLSSGCIEYNLQSREIAVQRVASMVKTPTAKTAAQVGRTEASNQPYVPRRPGAGLTDQATLGHGFRRGESLAGNTLSDHRTRETVSTRIAGSETAPRMSWQFESISVLAPNRPPKRPTPAWLIQPKLAVGAVNDPLEHEADRIADAVMGMPVPESSITAGSPQLSRKCAACEQGEKVQILRTKPARSANPVASEAPPIVHEALRIPGQPLDPATVAFFEPRLGFDLSRVRIHVDAQADKAAAAIRARAYTAGADVVFARGEFAPATAEGRRLLAHELTHVAQQAGVPRIDRPRPADPAVEIGTSPASGAVRRQPSNDPNKSPQTVDPSGKLAPGTAAASKAPGVWRIPIQGLRNDPKAWAVVLIPNVNVPTISDVPVDVLLHFHGYGAGYRMLKSGETDYAGVLKPGQLRDVDLYEMEQQLLSVAQAGKKYVIAVLPQGSDRSNFGDLSTHSGEYLKEVFARLIADGHLPQGTPPGNVIVSGHSGGGVAASATAKDRGAPGGRQDLLLFDAINFKCVDEVQEERKGEKVVNPDGTPKMICKRCASNEYKAVSKWVTDRIKYDAKIQISQKNLKDFGTRFRGFTHAKLDAKGDTCSYGYWYALLGADIDKTITDLGASADVVAQLHDNFQIKSVTGKHEDVMAHGNLEAALAD